MGGKRQLSSKAPQGGGSVVSLTGAEHCNAEAAVAAVSALLGGIFTFTKECLVKVTLIRLKAFLIGGLHLG